MLRSMHDFHSHLMPAVDDGSQSLAESHYGLETMVGQGVNVIITTPHIRASLTSHSRELEDFLKLLDDAWTGLSTLAEEEFPDVRLERGAEVMLDIPFPDLSDPRLRLAGTNFVLVEFPYMMIPPRSAEALSEIRAGGWIPIVAHPERYGNISANVARVDEWRDAGAYMQVNAGSLVGRYGTTPRRVAWDLLARGAADYLSSDYHSRGPCDVAECAELLAERGATAQLSALGSTNAERLLRGEHPQPVPALEMPADPFWRRLLRRS